MKSKKLPLIFFIALIPILIVGIIQSHQKKNNLIQNGNSSLGQITSYSGGRGPKINYKFEVRGKVIYGSNHYSGWNDTIQANMGKIGNYYEVKYLEDNPKESIIIIGEKSIIPKDIMLKNTIAIPGEIDSIRFISAIPDLFVSYSYNQKKYRIRSRINPSAFGLEAENCAGKAIPLTISRKYPFISNVYLESVDRRGMF